VEFALDTGLKLLFSARGTGEKRAGPGRKRKPRSGRCRSCSGEAAAYGYEAEDRLLLQCFLKNEQRPWLTSTTVCAR